MNRVFLCLGGNLGNRLDNLNKGISKIEENAGKILQRSAIYETEAWGSNSAKKYLNMCIEITTKLKAEQLIKALLKIENELGRNRGRDRNSDRTIDIDILFFNKTVIKTRELEIPHPRLHLRKFVLKPLYDIAPEFVHPELKVPVKQLLKLCKDKLKVKTYSPKKLVCVEGNIGSGKTTLARLLADKMKANFVAEEFEDNALLPMFYNDPQKFALALETSFLLNRFKQLQKVFFETENHIVCDYSIYKCLWFAKNNLNQNDLKHFRKIFDTIASALKQPDLIVFLKTDTFNLQKNIKKRGRTYEQSISDEYLNNINKAYAEGIKELRNNKVIEKEITKYTKLTMPDIAKEILKELNKS